ncbi:hypothetical protein PsW64_05207 [Pseudovibrio sp. W64]|uniref:DUF6950 family protein n=1 Tax=Pseudovibrio sp. W64 TaxID=1735583 RepID=UPI0007AED57C|nr:hypothetical protein [Pseudovibrio sp. W64]KZK76478.1 hypothetical protein PsW64_05207 [Pseudovibrio sp. W64]
MATCLNNLQGWLSDRRDMRFDPGKADCCLVLADWACFNGYPDGAQFLRGTYSTTEELNELLTTSGGALGLVEGCVAIAGLLETRSSKIGDIGVVGSLHNPLRQWGAIWDGLNWQVHWRDGFETIHAPALKIWSV